MQKTSIGRYIIILLMFVFTVTSTIAQKFSPSSYIAQHKDLAQQLMNETGVPASVILAIAFHESAYGNSKVAKHLNNHFGIKGKNNSKTIRSAYKGYGSVEESYRDFVGLMQRRKANRVLFEKYDSDDYEGWIKGIFKAGYTRLSSWTPKVLATIRRYKLDEYDRIQTEPVSKGMLAKSGTAKIQQDILLRSMEANDASADFMAGETHVVTKGDTLSELATRYNTSVDALKRRNNLHSSKLSIGQRLLL
ncbi:glucosaminidase domain-containing protein [Sphingobacterium sp. SGR-19]|uniref:glucosaminidase domain-containing protein n=1 Tax=Sphingobacterium sp. SGR-19 TaxID=2710886 RepID=UPI0013ED2FED|nr:glucosaminidase domain-containing protein [Sphingobacterium sp. SGR-19]NGM65548.1 LysM peptidoglycan-binding domain-containing protein [Sphingobacterium sp. SGR-19]